MRIESTNIQIFNCNRHVRKSNNTKEKNEDILSCK